MKQILKAMGLACVLVLCCAIYSHATSGDITLGAHTATIETENTQHLATLGGFFGTITNTGAVDIEIGENGQTISTAGVQREGQFTLKVGMTVPVILWNSFSFKSATAGQIVYVPYRG